MQIGDIHSVPTEKSISIQIDINMKTPIITTIDAYSHLKKMWSSNDINLHSRANVLALDFDGNYLYRLYYQNLYDLYNNPDECFKILRRADDERACNTQKIIIGENSIYPQLTTSSGHENFVKAFAEKASKEKIRVVDHFIISSSGFISFKERNLIP